MLTHDDLEADDAVAVLKMYWPIGRRLSDAVNDWARCHDHCPGYPQMRECLQRTLETSKAAARDVPHKKMTRLPCGIEIEDAHLRYVESQIAHFTRMTQWAERNASDLEVRMRDKPLAEVWPEIVDKYPIDMSYGYAQIMDVERTKALFQCGPEDNLASINKVAARLKLGPESEGGGSLRVRSSQRVLVP
ncbi:hypothetical protein WME76_24875 [Sorangium sp. So ce119]|uniref:hypothetical protein n=1 Tax=Sorangium sp. So ce119 TaxID=3133279 RepID=UPI003F5DD23E